MSNGSLSNGIMMGVAEKYRNAQIYTLDKYSTMLADLSTYAKGSVPLMIAVQNNELSKLFKEIYFSNFCSKDSHILDSWIAT